MMLSFWQYQLEFLRRKNSCQTKVIAMATRITISTVTLIYPIIDWNVCSCMLDFDVFAITETSKNGPKKAV